MIDGAPYHHNCGYAACFEHFSGIAIEPGCLVISGSNSVGCVGRTVPMLFTLMSLLYNYVGCVGRTVPMLFTLMSLLYNFFPYSNQRSLIFSVSYMN